MSALTFVRSVRGCCFADKHQSADNRVNRLFYLYSIRYYS